MNAEILYLLFYCSLCSVVILHHCFRTERICYSYKINVMQKWRHSIFITCSCLKIDPTLELQKWQEYMHFVTREYVYCLVQWMQAVNVFCFSFPGWTFFILKAPPHRNKKKQKQQQMSCRVYLGLDISAVICSPCYKSFVLSRNVFCICSPHFRRGMIRYHGFLDKSSHKNLLVSIFVLVVL